MNLFAFELGREKELCFAELISVIGKENLIERNLDTAVFKLPKELKDLSKLQNKLGGTIKIIELLEPLPLNAYRQSSLEESIADILNREFKDLSGKIPFSISVLSLKNISKINIKKLLNFSKKILKSLGLNSRFVNKNFKNTKPSTIFKAKVIEKGIDINVIFGEKDLWLGKTVTIQNIDNYSKRDFDKPKRDARVGMLPPKLAQIMLNLAEPANTILDPFCGTGTLLMEGLLMDKAVVGSDIEERMKEYSEENCNWLKSEFATKPAFHVFTRDARFLTPQLLKEHSNLEKVDAVVTEGYLGEPLSKFPLPEKMEMLFRELANLHLNWLQAIHPLLKKEGKVVMCLTGYQKNPHEIIHFPRFPEIAETNGFEIEQKFSYKRPDQVVVRDILVLRKKC